MGKLELGGCGGCVTHVHRHKVNKFNLPNFTADIAGTCELTRLQWLWTIRLHVSLCFEMLVMIVVSSRQLELPSPQLKQPPEAPPEYPPS